MVTVSFERSSPCESFKVFINWFIKHLQLKSDETIYFLDRVPEGGKTSDYCLSWIRNGHTSTDGFISAKEIFSDADFLDYISKEPVFSFYSPVTCINFDIRYMTLLQFSRHSINIKEIWCFDKVLFIKSFVKFIGYQIICNRDNELSLWDEIEIYHFTRYKQISKCNIRVPLIHTRLALEEKLTKIFNRQQIQIKPNEFKTKIEYDNITTTDEFDYFIKWILQPFNLDKVIITVSDNRDPNKIYFVWDIGKFTTINFINAMTNNPVFVLVKGKQYHPINVRHFST